MIGRRLFPVFFRVQWWNLFGNAIGHVHLAIFFWHFCEKPHNFNKHVLVHKHEHVLWTETCLIWLLKELQRIFSQKLCCRISSISHECKNTTRILEYSKLKKICKKVFEIFGSKHFSLFIPNQNFAFYSKPEESTPKRTTAAQNPTFTHRFSQFYLKLNAAKFRDIDEIISTPNSILSQTQRIKISRYWRNHFDAELKQII